MTKHSLKLSAPRVRDLAHAYIDKAPEGTVVSFETEPKRSLDANAKLWAMLSDISKQCEHNGQQYSPEVWKVLMMSSLGHECRFVLGLEGEAVPMGFRSSQMTVSQMSDLIEWIYKWGAENGVRWSEKGWNYE